GVEDFDPLSQIGSTGSRNFEWRFGRALSANAWLRARGMRNLLACCGWNLARHSLKLATKEGTSTLAVSTYCLSRFGQVAGSRGAFTLGRAVLPWCDGAWPPPRRALAVGGTAVLH